ncbi:MAG: LysE family translocator [Flavobacteriaceae bacterium]
MTIATYIAYVFACAAIIVVPGPTVTVIIANSIRHGARAGLMNVAGTQLGLAIMVAILAVGLQAVVATMAGVFDFLRLAGAAYLVWLGIKLWRADGALLEEGAPQAGSPGTRTHFWQGFFVILSNPKALFFFGAFIPQFIDPAGDTVLQTALLGGTFMVVATIFDGAYAILAGRAGKALTRSRLRIAERISGTFLIGGGVWLALLRR